MARALELAETAGALRRYGRRAGEVMVIGGVLFALAAGVALVAPGETWTGDLIGALVVLGVLTSVTGAGAWALARRMRRALGSGGWSAHAAVSVRSMRSTEAVVLRSLDGDGLWPLEAVAMRHRYELLRPGPDGVMWWCGDPSRGGVLAPPGGGALIWARPVRHRRARHRIVEQAERSGVLDRAALAQPPGQEPRVVPPAPVTPVPVPVTPVPVPVTPVPVPVTPVPVPVTPVPEPVPVPAPRLSLVKRRSDTSSAPTYARLAAHARRQAVPQTRTRRPEADVREVAWWRVRSLRRTAGFGQVVLPLAGCVALGAAAFVRPEGGGLMYLYVAAILALGALVYSGHRLLTAGVPAVRVMARAARSPVPVPRRYALLHDPRGGAPVLALFHAHGGPDALPEGLLVLLSPGTAKHPRLGLPPEPTGTVELRGWRDHSADGRPVVVPWFDGRALWPAEPYIPADGAESAALLARLAPPLSPRVRQEEIWVP
ncbi:hypothetical protein ABT034_02740 [Streptomyces sp. NPDC002773]|uniref:hypothetical protein n=1 Tax=Streptomyces sp. NPDC002773 TaxID=3154430 RepID=UPI0033180B86